MASPSKRPRLSEEYKQEKEFKEIESDTTSRLQIPSLDVRSDDFSPEKFLEAYKSYQAVHLPAILSQDSSNGTGLITWRDISSLFKQLSQVDKDSWCIETVGYDEEEKISSYSFLSPEIMEQRAYCSFLVQKDKKSYGELLERLPLARLSFDENWSYEPCIWMFFGRNNKNGDDGSPLEGRGLHTDSVSHDGTWHFQLSGMKEWFLSPSCNLLEHFKSVLSTEECADWDESTKVHVPCNEGDLIVVNTRLWFHRTIIPPQKFPSVSYARDFHLEGANTAASFSGVDGDGSMKNLDGLYARTDIESGTIIFTETDMPDCELHRSNDDPNCELVELEDGRSAVVSRRTITSGEFFCVAESSDEEDEQDEEECDEIESENED